MGLSTDLRSTEDQRGPTGLSICQHICKRMTEYANIRQRMRMHAQCSLYLFWPIALPLQATDRSTLVHPKLATSSVPLEQFIELFVGIPSARLARGVAIHLWLE